MLIRQTIRNFWTLQAAKLNSESLLSGCIWTNLVSFKFMFLPPLSFIIYLFNKYLFLNLRTIFINCCSVTVVLIFPSLLSPTVPSPIFHIQSPPPLSCCLCPWVLYTCSLTLSFLSPIGPLLPSLWSLSVCSFFHVSVSILLTCLFCWLGSTYRWDHMIFLFYHLAYFT